MNNRYTDVTERRIRRANKAGLKFAETVKNICEEGGKVPFMLPERTVWICYRNHLARLGPDWLKKGTAKLRELVTWRDSDDDRTTADLKKAFVEWLVHETGYEKYYSKNVIGVTKCHSHKKYSKHRRKPPSMLAFPSGRYGTGNIGA